MNIRKIAFIRIRDAKQVRGDFLVRENLLLSVEIDMDGLVQEQEQRDRRSWLAKALNRPIKKLTQLACLRLQNWSAFHLSISQNVEAYL